MTFRYLFGIPGNLDEFIKYAKKHKGKNILYRQQYSQESETNMGAFMVDRLVIDNGLKGFRHRRLTLYDNSFNENHPSFGNLGRQTEMTMEKVRVLETLARYGVNVTDLGIVKDRKVKI